MCSNRPKTPVDSSAAHSYIISGVYGFLISHYSSPNDVTDMDSEHTSDRILEDIHYRYTQTFDQRIKIDGLLYPDYPKWIFGGN